MAQPPECHKWDYFMALVFRMAEKKIPTGAVKLLTGRPFLVADIIVLLGTAGIDWIIP